MSTTCYYGNVHEEICVVKTVVIGVPLETGLWAFHMFIRIPTG